ncbi:VanZ family protein [Virgibacillus sp. W0430]|uniref:VanZ family protein n=1 Tax=Virgibacillus sp. W0430 TaxID=3391580 RepID=UPI003F45DCEE
MRKYFSWLAVFIWMGCIFYLSHQPATNSDALSSNLTQVIMEWFTTIAPQVEIQWDMLHHLIRKNAHFIAYFILGVVVLNALQQLTASTQKVECRINVKNFSISLLICICYALSDEFHQLFIPGRSGEWRDVGIDSAGAIAGISTLFIIQKIKNRKAVSK